MTGPRRIAALIPAAGESTRMKRLKALLDWGGKPLLQHQIDVMTGLGCDPVVVVLGHRAAALRGATTCAPPCRMVENPAYRSGRSSSVRVGAMAIPDEVEAVLLASVDQPIGAGVAAAVLAAWDGEAPIVVPRYRGTNGHPALFAGRLLPEMRTVTEEGLGLKAVRATHAEETVFLDLDDPLVALNLNTPEAYEAARALAGLG